MYNFKIDNANKAVIITVEGFFTEKEALAYLAEYQKTTKSVNASQYKLIVDGRKQKTVSADVAGEMQQAVDLYLSSGFKKVCITLPESATAKMQVKRLRGYNSITWVNTPDEALAA